MSLKIFSLFFLISMTSCTLSFQNVDTHGTATDVVDSDPTNDVTASPTVTIPFKPL